MDQAIFVLCMLFMHNPHQNEIYALPPAFSAEIFREAAKYDNVQPEDIAGTIIAEHGGGAPYSVDSEGAAGERGLMQISEYWRKKYNRAHDTDLDAASLLEWRTNIAVGAWTIHTIKDNHANAARCRVKVWSTRVDANGRVEAVRVRQQHTWIAHYRCTYQARETCRTRWREQLIGRLAGWRTVRDVLRTESSTLGWTQPPLIGRLLRLARKRAGGG